MQTETCRVANAVHPKNGLLREDMRQCGKACHTAPRLLSPSLRDRVMSTSTTPMSSSRLLGSSKARDSSLTLEINKWMNEWVNEWASVHLNSDCQNRIVSIISCSLVPFSLIFKKSKSWCKQIKYMYTYIHIQATGEKFGHTFNIYSSILMTIDAAVCH